MTYALIDNSTLTAVQRVTGQILTKSKDSVDTDIVALENLIQAILFYDNIVAVDDYIPKYRGERLASFPFVTFLNSQEYGFDALENKAAEKAAEIKPVIRGGEFANEDFRELISLLQTHMVCTWDISSSVYYLTLKGLVAPNSQEFQKYGNLAAAIFGELNDATETGNRTSGQVSLIDRYGNPITEGYKVPGARWGDGTSGGATAAIGAFVAALVWLANRSIFYSLTAKYLHADTFLYPIRQSYQQYYISKVCGYGQDYSKRLVELFSTSLGGDLIDINDAGLATSTAIDLPVFSAWLAKETGDVAAIIDTAMQIRDEPEFVEAREQLKAIRNSFDSDDIAAANKNATSIISDIGKSSAAIRTKYGIQTPQGVPLTRLVQVYNTYAATHSLPAIPEWDLKIPLPEFLRDMRKHNGFNAIYRNISHDLSSVWALGEARDILGARVVIDEKARAYNPKSEAPEHRNAHAPFKSPM